MNKKKAGPQTRFLTADSNCCRFYLREFIGQN
jgi:hypothetical protein